ncbi:phage holin family protein [Marmoricola sp. RAF53]|uniref:phage holin family protein n=1 Tax=Marmoricola sp. RAF53 TaxID=3233059 RepID=UPI003F9D463D
MGFLVWVVANAVAVGFATWLFDDITVTGDTTTDRILTLLLIGLIFGLVNSVVRPVVNLLSLPLIILTLGLMLVVTNALMLLLTSKIADWLDIGFHVEGFWTAIGASIVISITSMVIDAVLPD